MFYKVTINTCFEKILKTQSYIGTGTVLSLYKFDWLHTRFREPIRFINKWQINQINHYWLYQISDFD